MLVWYGVWPAAPMLLFPVFLALQVVFTVGLGMILATGTAFFRDVRHLVEVGLAVLFWTTPIVYQLQEVPERLRWIILLSPASPFIHAYQQIFYYRTWPDAATWIVACAYAVGAFALGLWFIVRSEDQLAESI
jgi:lipopolysaccharide transport system permease protein